METGSKARRDLTLGFAVRDRDELCVLTGHYLVNVYGLLLPNEWESFLIQGYEPWWPQFNSGIKTHHPRSVANADIIGGC